MYVYSMVGLTHTLLRLKITITNTTITTTITTTTITTTTITTTTTTIITIRKAKIVVGKLE